jgi:hypothetical protein
MGSLRIRKFEKHWTRDSERQIVKNACGKSVYSATDSIFPTLSSSEGKRLCSQYVRLLKLDFHVWFQGHSWGSGITVKCRLFVQMSGRKYESCTTVCRNQALHDQMALWAYTQLQSAKQFCRGTDKENSAEPLCQNKTLKEVDSITYRGTS